MVDGSDDWWVICLCADWCSVCRGLRSGFDALAAQQPDVHFAWVDVEDEEDLVGELEIETFPTVLMGSRRELRFAGVIQPQIQVLTRLMAGVLGSPGEALGVAETHAVLQRVIASRG